MLDDDLDPATVDVIDWTPPLALAENGNVDAVDEALGEETGTVGLEKRGDSGSHTCAAGDWLLAVVGNGGRSTGISPRAPRTGAAGHWARECRPGGQQWPRRAGGNRDGLDRRGHGQGRSVLLFEYLDVDELMRAGAGAGAAADDGDRLLAVPLLPRVAVEHTPR